MNIAILSTSDSGGGAAIAANRLMKGLRLIDHEAFMVVREKMGSDPYVNQIVIRDSQWFTLETICNAVQEGGINRNRSEISNTLFSLPCPGVDLSAAPIISRADIINLHWVAHFLSIDSIAALFKTGKPVVWTLHDENAYTGGCHYTAGCRKYIDGVGECADCSQLQDNEYQVPYHFLQHKIAVLGEHLSNLTIVTPSHWLGRCARQSRLFKNVRVEVIPNSVDTGIFKPYDKEQAKKKLGIQPHVFTLLFGAYTGFEKRKGFSKLLDAMKYCLQDGSFRQAVQDRAVQIITYGPPQDGLEKIEIEIVSTGFTNDLEKLATIYSAADLFVIPSLEDNLPNTMVEAMACGTPVLGFKTGGIPDIVQDSVTGYTVPAGDTQKLGEKIKTLILSKDKNQLLQMGRNCRELIEKKYKLQDQANSYTKLFDDLLSKKNSSDPVIIPAAPSPVNLTDRIVENNDTVIIPKPNTMPDIPKGLYPLYWKYTLTALNNQEKYIQRIHSSPTYRVTRSIFNILRKIRKILKQE